MIFNRCSSFAVKSIVALVVMAVSISAVSAAEKAPKAHKTEKSAVTQPAQAQSEANAAEMMAKLPKPTKEHEWLQQFVGQWKSETEMMQPGKTEAVKVTGTETVKPLGEFWTISEVQSTMGNQPFKGNMTLGFDADKQKYVGTWVDNITGQLWNYEGTTDAAGKVLTLEAEGKCPMNGKLTRFQDVFELKDKNTKVMTSKMLDEKGQWVTMMTGTSTRVE